MKRAGIIICMFLAMLLAGCANEGTKETATTQPSETPNTNFDYVKTEGAIELTEATTIAYAYIQSYFEGKDTQYNVMSPYNTIEKDGVECYIISARDTESGEDIYSVAVAVDKSAVYGWEGDDREGMQRLDVAPSPDTTATPAASPSATQTGE